MKIANLKKIIAQALALIIIASLVSCSGGENVSDITTDEITGETLEVQSTGTAQTDIQTETPMPEVIVNVKDHGAVGDGVTDDTEAFKKALAKLNAGEGFYIPSGRYLLSGNITFTKSNITVFGDGKKSSQIFYTKEQGSYDSMLRASLFTFSRVNGLVVRDLFLEYGGDFRPAAEQTLTGLVNGIYLFGCNNVKIMGIEAFRFNYAGVFLGSGSDYLVENCDLHHNRVAGLLYKDVSDVLIQKNTFNHNGSEPDGGTGYGCVATSSAKAHGVKVINNVANYNYRKGIDVHSGSKILIDSNKCHANRLYGIYAEGTTTSEITITNNKITGMTSANTTLGEPYGTVFGICVGVYSETNDGKERNHTVANNELLGFDAAEGQSLPFYIFGSNDKGTIKFTDNVVEGKTVDYLMCVQRNSKNNDHGLKIEFSGNKISVERVRKDAFIFYAKELDIKDNTVGIGQYRGGDLIKAYGATNSTLTLSNNTFSVDSSSKTTVFGTISFSTVNKENTLFNGKEQ